MEQAEREDLIVHIHFDAKYRVNKIDLGVDDSMNDEQMSEALLNEKKEQEEGFTAFDNHDGDITAKVKCVEEYEKITYVVMDSSGNPASVERLIPYYDPLPPEIHLTGGEQYAIPAGTFSPRIFALDKRIYRHT